MARAAAIEEDRKSSLSNDAEMGKDFRDLERSPTNGKNMTGVVVAEALAEETFIVDPAAERRLVWKYDLRILPVLAVMYLFNALDKSNLGNAKTAGLTEDLHFHGNQYNIILSVFFVPYVLTAPVLGILGKKYGPSRVLPLMMLTFGFMTLMVITVKDFSGMMAVRWFLGERFLSGRNFEEY